MVTAPFLVIGLWSGCTRLNFKGDLQLHFPLTQNRRSGTTHSFFDTF